MCFQYRKGLFERREDFSEGGIEAVEDAWGSLNIMEKLLFERSTTFSETKGMREINVGMC